MKRIFKMLAASIIILIVSITVSLLVHIIAKTSIVLLIVIGVVALLGCGYVFTK